MLTSAFRAYLAAEPLRAARQRHKRYTYGDQWSDIVDDPATGPVPERRLIERTGRRPQTNNLIRRLVKSIVGRYRTAARADGYYSDDPASVDVRNSLPELDARLLEEFIISGCAIQRVVAERRPGGSGVWVDNVSPDNFFINRFTDPRGSDITLIGMLHQMSWPEVVNRFGHGSRTRIAGLRRLFDAPDARAALPPDEFLGMSLPADADTFFTSAPDRLRVIEVWNYEGRQSSRRGKVAMDMVWTCRWYAPDGTLLDRYNSPFTHGSHPFTVCLYPLTDGEVHSFVEDVIDQQRAINRLVVLLDTIMASSAKGALLFPMDQLVPGYTLENIASLWARPDAVIPIRKSGDLPQQVAATSGGAGAYQLLDLQMKLFDNISGVGDTLLGRNISPATGANLYDAQLREATTVITDLLETFRTFTARRSAKAART